MFHEGAFVEMRQMVSASGSLSLSLLRNLLTHFICRYQAKLQQNLMYLAAIADAQPQVSQNSTQVASDLLNVLME